jgi:hypothetical protein
MAKDTPTATAKAVFQMFLSMFFLLLVKSIQATEP